MSFANFSPGSYAVTWNSTDLGLVENPHRFDIQPMAQPIKVDKYGDSNVDGVYRGKLVYIMCTFAEWTANLKLAMNPYSTALGLLGLVGRLNSDIYKPLVLTPQALTPAAVLGATIPNTFTFGVAGVAPQNRISWLLGNVHRNIPILFEALLYDSGSGVMAHFITS